MVSYFIDDPRYAVVSEPYKFQFSVVQMKHFKQLPSKNRFDYTIGNSYLIYGHNGLQDVRLLYIGLFMH